MHIVENNEHSKWPNKHLLFFALVVLPHARVQAPIDLVSGPGMQLACSERGFSCAAWAIQSTWCKIWKGRADWLHFRMSRSGVRSVPAPPKLARGVGLQLRPCYCCLHSTLLGVTKMLFHVKSNAAPVLSERTLNFVITNKRPPYPLTFKWHHLICFIYRVLYSLFLIFLCAAF